jgi:hypothetical protein
VQRDIGGIEIIEARALDACNALKEIEGGAIRRGDPERVVDQWKLWGKPGDITVVTPGNAAEASGRALDGRLTCAITEDSTSEICAPRSRAVLRRQSFSKTLTISAEAIRLDLYSIYMTITTKTLNIGPKWHAHAKKVLKMTKPSGYSTYEGIYEVQ